MPLDFTGTFATTCIVLFTQRCCLCGKKKWQEAKYICLKGLTHQFTGSKRHEAHYWQKPILLLIRKYGTLRSSQMICSWHLGGIKNSIYWICGGPFTSVHQCCIWCISTTNRLYVLLLQLAPLWWIGDILSDKLINKQFHICYNWPSWAFKAIASLAVIRDGAKKGCGFSGVCCKMQPN